MLVKAKWNVKGSDGWHFGGEVFNTEEDYGEAVEVLEKVEKNPAKEPEPVKEPETAAEPEKAEKPRTSSRRKKIAE